MTTSHNHKYSSPEVANKLNEMEMEENSEKSPELSKNGRISKHYFITIGVTIVIVIIIGVIIGVLSKKNRAETDITIEGKLTTYKREAVPGEDDAYKFTPYEILNDGKQSRIDFKNFLEQIEHSNDADDFANDFLNSLKKGAIFDEYIFESPLSNASHFEFKLKGSKGLEGKSPSKPEICKTKFTTQTTKTNNKIVVFPCPPQSGSDDAKYSTLASFVRDAPKEEVITFFKDAFYLLLETINDDSASVKEWCFSTSNSTTGWVQGIIDSNSNACYTT